LLELPAPDPLELDPSPDDKDEPSVLEPPLELSVVPELEESLEPLELDESVEDPLELEESLELPESVEPL